MKTQKIRAKELAEAEEKKLEKAKKDMEAVKKRGVFSDGISDLTKIDKVDNHSLVSHFANSTMCCCNSFAVNIC